MSRKKPNWLNRAMSLLCQAHFEGENMIRVHFQRLAILEIGDEKTKEKRKDRCVTTLICMYNVHTCMYNVHTGFCTHALDMMHVKCC